MMRYFSSDLHLNHANIIRYCNRPCTPETHKDWIMSHFDHLKEGDELYVLGDIMFKPKLETMMAFFQFFADRGVILFIALGNHDEPFVSIMLEAYRKVFCKSGMDYIKHYFSLPYRNDPDVPFPKIVMSHYPMESWDSSHHGSVMLHGHTHGHSKKRKNRFDMGLDVEHKVYSITDIIDMYNRDALKLSDEKIASEY